MPSLTDDLRNDPTDGRAQNEGVVFGAISGGGDISDDLPLPTLPNDFPTATASNSAPLDNFQTPVTDVSSAAPVVDNGMPIDPVTPPPQTAFVSMATSASPISSVSAPSTAPAPTFASVAVPGVTEANSTIFNTPTIDTPSPTVSTVDYSTPINSAIGFSGSASSYAEDFAKRFEQASQNAPIGPDLSVQMSTEPIPGQISSNFAQRFAQAQAATAPTADTSTPNASTGDYSTPAVPVITDDVPPTVQNSPDQSSVFADDAPDPVIINNVNTDPTPTNEKSASGVILSSVNEPVVAAIGTVTPLKVTPATSERSAATPTVDTVAPSTAAYNIPSYQDTSPTTTVEKSVAQPVKSVKTEPVTANSSPISPVREPVIASHAPTPEPTTSVSSVSTQNNKPSLKIDGPSLSTNSNLSTDPDSITNKHLDELGLEQSKETIKKAIDAQEKERFAEAMPDVSTPVPTANEHVEIPVETVSTTNDRAEIKVEPPAPAFDIASSSDYSTPANSANASAPAETTVTASSTPEPAPAATSVSDTTTSSTIAYNIPSNQAISDNSAPAFVENVTPADAAASTPAASAPETNRGEHYAQYLGSADQVNPVTATAGVVGGLTGLAVPARNPEPAVNADSADTQSSEPSLKVSGPSLSTNSKMSTDPDSAAKKHLDQLGLGHSKGGLRDKINAEEEARLADEATRWRETLEQTNLESIKRVEEEQASARAATAAREAEQLARARGENTGKSPDFSEKLASGAAAVAVAPAAVVAESATSVVTPSAGATETLASDQAALSAETPAAISEIPDADTIFTSTENTPTLADDQAALTRDITGSEVTTSTSSEANFSDQTSFTDANTVTTDVTSGTATTVSTPTISTPGVGGLTTAPTGSVATPAAEGELSSGTAAEPSASSDHLKQFKADHSKDALRRMIGDQENARLEAEQARFEAEQAALTAERDAAQLQAARAAAIRRQLESMPLKQLSQLAHSLGVEPTPAAPPLPTDTLIPLETLSAAAPATYDLDALAHQLETLAEPSVTAATINLPEYGDFSFDATPYLPPEISEGNFAVPAPSLPFADVAEPASFAAASAGAAVSGGFMAPSASATSVGTGSIAAPTAGQIYSSTGAESRPFSNFDIQFFGGGTAAPAGEVTDAGSPPNISVAGGAPGVTTDFADSNGATHATDVVYDAGGESGSDRALAGLAAGGVGLGGAAGLGTSLAGGGSNANIGVPGEKSLAQDFHARTGLGSPTEGQTSSMLDGAAKVNLSGALPAGDGSVSPARAGGQLAHQVVSGAKRGLNPLKDLGSNLVTKMLPNAIDSLRRLNKRLRRAIQALSWLMPVLVPLGAGLAVFLTIAGIWLAIVGLFDSGAAKNQGPGATPTKSEDECLSVQKVAEPSKIGNPPDASTDKRVKYTIQISPKEGQTAIFDGDCSDQIKVKCKKEGEGGCSNQTTDISTKICQDIKEQWGEKLSGKGITVDYYQNYTGNKDYLMTNTVTFKAHCEKKEESDGASSSTDSKSSGGTASKSYPAMASVCVGKCGGEGMCWPFVDDSSCYASDWPHGSSKATYSKIDLGCKNVEVKAPMTGMYTFSYNEKVCGSDVGCNCLKNSCTGTYNGRFSCNRLMDADQHGLCKGGSCVLNGKSINPRSLICGGGCKVTFTSPDTKRSYNILHLDRSVCSKWGTGKAIHINQGETIGRTDATGANTGPHTHFETSSNANVLQEFFPNNAAPRYGYIEGDRSTHINNASPGGPQSRNANCNW